VAAVRGAARAPARRLCEGGEFVFRQGGFDEWEEEAFLVADVGVEAAAELVQAFA